jgi:hypothetical protein
LNLPLKTAARHSASHFDNAFNSVVLLASAATLTCRHNSAALQHKRQLPTVVAPLWFQFNRLKLLPLQLQPLIAVALLQHVPPAARHHRPVVSRKHVVRRSPVARRSRNVELLQFVVCRVAKTAAHR